MILLSKLERLKVEKKSSIIGIGINFKIEILFPIHVVSLLCRIFYGFWAHLFRPDL